LDQSDSIGAKSSIFALSSLVAPQPFTCVKTVRTKL